MSTPASRQPKGIPTGGQFAVGARSESAVTLGETSAPASAAAAEALAPALDMNRVEAERHVRALIDQAAADSDPERVDAIATLAASPGWKGVAALRSYPHTSSPECGPSTYLPTKAAATRTAEYASTVIAAAERRAQARERLDSLTTTDEDGHRWVETHADFWAAEEERIDFRTPTPFADLKPRDRFVLTEGNRLVECEVIGEPFDTTDLFGRPARAFEARRRDHGGTGLHLYGAGEIAQKVEQPVRLRVDPAEQPTERDLNEAWGL